jgi:hypothetical protein
MVVGLALVLVALVYRHLNRKPAGNQSLLQATPATNSTVSAVPEFPKLPELANKSRQNAQLAKAVEKESRRDFVRDIFAPLIALPKEKPPPKKRQPQPPKRTISLKLNGVIIGGRNPVAIINDKFVRLGERIDGYKVVRIEKKEVFLKSSNRTIQLRLATNE